MTTKITTSDKAIVAAIVDEVYRPSARQREFKAMFWNMWTSGPSQVGAPTVEDAIRLTSCATIGSWSKDPKFKGWFFNEDEFGQRADFLANQALDVIQEVMASEKAADRLNAAKFAVEVAGKAKKAKTEIKFLDDEVGNMDEKQLEDFIRKHKA